MSASRFTHHVFVCVNDRPEGSRPSCGGRGLVEALQAELARRPALWDRVAVTATGCLGPCFDGPSVVVYPEGVWYARVAVADVAEIVERHLAGGEPVARLVYHWPAAE